MISYKLQHLVPDSFSKSIEKVYFERDSKVDINWFIPFLPIEDRMHSGIFLAEWLEYGARQDYYNMDFETKIEYLLTKSNADHTEHNGRVAASVFAWMGTDIGLSHIEALAEQLQKNQYARNSNTNNVLAVQFWSEISSYTSNVIAIQFWNELSSHTPRGNHVLGYRLRSILNKKPKEELTYQELSIAQTIFVYISNYEGLQFLLRTLKKINEDKERKKKN